jgi:elongation factor P--beta-lysine ligase
MDMPLDYICEMLCDWHSFSYKNPESTALAWYNEHKDEFRFSDKTRELVDELIKCMNVPITTV